MPAFLRNIEIIGLCFSFMVASLVSAQQRTDASGAANEPPLLGRRARAIRSAEERLELMQARFGVDSPEAADAMSDIGLLYKYSGDYSHAEDYYRRALAIVDRVPEAHASQVFKVLVNLGELYRGMLRFADAKPILQRALNFGRTVLADRPEAAYAYNSMGLLNFEQRKYEDAEPLLKTALAIREGVPNVDKELIAVSLDNLGQNFLEQARFPEAEDCFRRGLAIFREKLGDDDPDTVACARNLATLYNRTRRHEEALKLLTATLAATKTARGEDNDETAALFQQRGRVYMDIWQFSPAEVDLKRALMIADSLNGKTSQRMRGVLGDLSRLNERSGDYAQADTLLERALKVKAGDSRPDDETLAAIHKRRGWLQLRQENPRAAKESLQRVLELNTRTYGADTLVVAADLNDLCRLS